jgi:hypothetical protein
LEACFAAESFEPESEDFDSDFVVDESEDDPSDPSEAAPDFFLP